MTTAAHDKPESRKLVSLGADRLFGARSRRGLLFGLGGVVALLWPDSGEAAARKRSRRERRRRNRKQGSGTDLAPLACDPTATSGIVGDVLIGPMCPVMREDEPCPDRPYAATLSVQTSDGQEVCSAASGEDGRFRIGLPPGDYVLVPDNGEFMLPYASPVPVTVIAEEFAYVLVSFDSGIR